MFLGYSPISVISLADPAFARSAPGDGPFVTFLVNVGNSTNGLPSRFQLSGGTGAQQGLQPVANSNGTYAVWTANGYTVLDLTQFAGFNTLLDNGYPLLMTLRNTLPSSGFQCSGAAVPFSTAEYTNEDGAGGGFMGPYVPLVDYIDPYDTVHLPTTAPTEYSLPAVGSCGVFPSGTSTVNSPSLSSSYDCLSTGEECVDFPNQYWPSSPTTTPPYLVCPTSTGTQPSPAIEFAGTQFPTPAITYEADDSVNCVPTTQPNPCSQLIQQSTQTTEEPGGTAWQPALPFTVIGNGFGFLPQLPVAVQSSSYIEVSSNGAGSGTSWDTNASAPCQMFIANWTNTSISLVANLPVGVQDDYLVDNSLSTVLSPLSDFSPFTFPAATGCPALYNAATSTGDTLTFTVTNPQNTGAPPSAISVTVSATTTSPK